MIVENSDQAQGSPLEQAIATLLREKLGSRVENIERKANSQHGSLREFKRTVEELIALGEHLKKEIEAANQPANPPAAAVNHAHDTKENAATEETKAEPVKKPVKPAEGSGAKPIKTMTKNLTEASLVKDRKNQNKSTGLGTIDENPLAQSVVLPKPNAVGSGKKSKEEGDPISKTPVIQKGGKKESKNTPSSGKAGDAHAEEEKTAKRPSAKTPTNPTKQERPKTGQKPSEAEEEKKEVHPRPSKPAKETPKEEEKKAGERPKTGKKPGKTEPAHPPKAEGGEDKPDAKPKPKPAAEKPKKEEKPKEVKPKPEVKKPGKADPKGAKGNAKQEEKKTEEEVKHEEEKPETKPEAGHHEEVKPEEVKPAEEKVEEHKPAEEKPHEEVKAEENHHTVATDNQNAAPKQEEHHVVEEVKTITQEVHVQPAHVEPSNENVNHTAPVNRTNGPKYESEDAEKLRSILSAVHIFPNIQYKETDSEDEVFNLARQLASQLEASISEMIANIAALKANINLEDPENAKPFAFSTITEAGFDVIEPVFLDELIGKELPDPSVIDHVQIFMIIMGYHVSEGSNEAVWAECKKNLEELKNKDILSNLKTIMQDKTNILIPDLVRIENIVKRNPNVLKVTVYETLDAFCGFISFGVKELCEYFGIVNAKDFDPEANNQYRIYIYNERKASHFRDILHKVKPLLH
eukprot:TRINITY_DN2965_c0_g1_i1.p1 TRINITY_DN2965_c0_g1~~TRINITY_DN2965_c0_g1_i1.p1  ORF type:complete len:692 (-),score=276.36 TRINITY_DN2965_c0_g1_i1:334-2409(-)